MNDIVQVINQQFCILRYFLFVVCAILCFSTDSILLHWAALQFTVDISIVLYYFIFVTGVIAV